MFSRMAFGVCIYVCMCGVRMFRMRVCSLVVFKVYIQVVESKEFAV